MKKLIAEIPTDLHTELKLVALEFDMTMKEFINGMVFQTLLDNLKNFSPEILEKCNITEDDLKKRLSKLRLSRHTG